MNNTYHLLGLFRFKDYYSLKIVTNLVAFSMPSRFLWSLCTYIKPNVKNMRSTPVLDATANLISMFDLIFSF